MNRIIVFLLSSILVSGSVFAWNNKNTISNVCQPYNVFVEEGEIIQISWETVEKCSGFVKYGDDINDLKYTSVSSIGSVTAKKHKVELKELKDDILYIIVSDGVEYGINGLPLYKN